jgi:hypothetical protein
MGERRAGRSGSEDQETPVGDEVEETPPGGDETTAEQLQADNPVEEDTIRALDPDAPSA